MATLTETVKVRLTPEERALLIEQAKRERRSQSEVVRWALIRYLVGRSAHVAAVQEGEK